MVYLCKAIDVVQIFGIEDWSLELGRAGSKSSSGVRPSSLLAVAVAGALRSPDCKALASKQGRLPESRTFFPLRGTSAIAKHRAVPDAVRVACRAEASNLRLDAPPLFQSFLI